MVGVVQVSVSNQVNNIELTDAQDVRIWVLIFAY
jgi:hypothetical protein